MQLQDKIWQIKWNNEIKRNVDKSIQQSQKSFQADFWHGIGPSGITFWQLHLGLLVREKIPKFRRKSTMSRVTRKWEAKKRLGLCAPIPPICGPKYTPGRLTLRKLWAKNRLSRPEPMHFRETLKTESVILTPPHAGWMRISGHQDWFVASTASCYVLLTDTHR